MKFYWLTLGILTTWRITHFLQGEDGPWDIAVRLRRFAGESFFGGLLDCFYCLSVWIAAPLAFLLGQDWYERSFLWPSFSAGAIIVERISNRSPKVPQAPFVEDVGKENQNVMLRSEKEQHPPNDSSYPD